MAVDLKQAYRQLLEEAYGKGRLAAFDEVCGRGLRSHDPVTGHADLRQAKESCAAFRSAFPGLQCTILAQYLDGETVITRWRMSGVHDGTLMGIPPTGAECAVERIDVARFQAGKVVEDWAEWDVFGLLRQLGVGVSAGSQGREAPLQL